MNFALSALIIIIIFLPGSVFIISYSNAFFEKESSFSLPFNELLIKGVIYSVFIHCSAICIIRLFFSEIRFDIIYNVLVGKDLNVKNSDLSIYTIQFGFYNTMLLFISFLNAKLFRIFARHFKLDSKVSFFESLLSQWI